MIPEFSACGYAVDWLKACYVNERRLFRDRPGELTPGRYYFVDPSTPMYPGENPFGSLKWHYGQTNVNAGLGEVRWEPRAFIAGDPPPQLPNVRRCGPVEYFTRGDPGQGVQPVYQGEWGFLPCCFLKGIPERPTRLEHFDFDNPAVRFMLIALARASYESTDANAVAIATAWLGAPDSVSFVANSGSDIPGSYVLIYPEFALVVSSGTTTPQQYAVQGVQSTLGPISVGPWGTMPLWYLAGLTVATRAGAAGLPTDRPVLFVGHSYGGAAVMNAAAIMHVAQPARPFAIFTLGMPRPGNEELINRTAAATRQLHVQNYADPVCALPPQRYWWGVFLPVIAQPVLDNWARFAGVERAVEQFDDGSITPVFESTALLAQMLTILASLIVIAPIPPFVNHTSGVYYDWAYRGIVGPQPDFPVLPAAIAITIGIYPPG